MNSSFDFNQTAVAARSKRLRSMHRTVHHASLSMIEPSSSHHDSNTADVFQHKDQHRDSGSPLIDHHYHEYHHHVTTPEEEREARILGLTLGFLVISQYILYIWKKRAYKSYQLATLGGVWLSPIIVLVGFQHSWNKFFGFWLLYTLVTSYYLKLCLLKPLPKTVPSRVYSWFLIMHTMSYYMVVFGYIFALIDVNDLNPLYLLIHLAPESWGLRKPYTMEELGLQDQRNLLQDGVNDQVGDQAGNHSNKQGLPPPDYYVLLHPEPWIVLWFRVFTTLSIFYGVYFGVLTRDIAEFCTMQLNAALGLSKKDDENEDTSDWSKRNLCSLCGESLNRSQATPSSGDRNSDMEKEKERVKLLNNIALLSHPAFGGVPGLNSSSNQKVANQRGGFLGGAAEEDSASSKNKKSYKQGKSYNNTLSLPWYQVIGSWFMLLLNPIYSVIAICESFVINYFGKSSDKTEQRGEKCSGGKLFKLNCGHSFHETCLRGWTIVGKQNICPYCTAPVDLSLVIGSSPWQKQSLIWVRLLDAARYLIVWHPIILCIAHFSIRAVLGYHPLLDDRPVSSSQV